MASSGFLTTCCFEYLNGCSSVGTEAFYFKLGSSVEVAYPSLLNAGYSYTPGEKLEGIYKIQNVTGNIKNVGVRCLSECDVKFNSENMTFKLELLCAKVHRIQISVDIDLTNEIEIPFKLKLDKQVLAVLEDGEGDKQFIKLPGYEYLDFQCTITKVTPSEVEIRVKKPACPVKVCGSSKSYVTRLFFDPSDGKPCTKNLVFSFNPDTVRKYLHTVSQISSEKPECVSIDRNCSECKLNWECSRHWGSPWSVIPPTPSHDRLAWTPHPTAPPDLSECVSNAGADSANMGGDTKDSNQAASDRNDEYEPLKEVKEAPTGLNIESLMKELGHQQKNPSLISQPLPNSSSSIPQSLPNVVVPSTLSSQPNHSPPIEGVLLKKQAFYESIFTSTKYTDVILVNTNGEEVRTFRCFLAEASPVFKAIFDSTDELPLRVEVGTFDCDTLQQVVKFCYGCTIFGNDMKLIKFATKFSMETLKTCCLHSLGNGITTANVCECIELAYAENNDVLKAKCRKVLSENKTIPNDVLRTLSKNILLDLLLA